MKEPKERQISPTGGIIPAQNVKPLGEGVVARGLQHAIGMMRDGIGEVVGRLGGGQKTQTARQLTPKQQVAKYLSLREHDREAIIKQRGPAEFGRYERAMLRLLERGDLT